MTATKTVRLTVDNLDTEGAALVGWLIEGGEDLGVISGVRVTRDGFDNAMFVGSLDRDVLGLPSTVTAYQP